MELQNRWPAASFVGASTAYLLDLLEYHAGTTVFRLQFARTLSTAAED
jgi:hypothetical protein